MLRPERVLVDRQRALEQRSRAREVAPSLKHGGEVSEGRRGMGVFGAKFFSRIASARSCNGRAPARSPWA